MFTAEFLLPSLVVGLIPGTGVIFTVSVGLMHGRRASLYASVGCTLGILPHLLATVLGLAVIMHTSAVAFQVLKYARVTYLLYLAIATWRDRSAVSVQEIMQKGSSVSFVVKAFLLNILNPKLTIFFLAFLPQFVASDTQSSLGQLLGFSAIFMTITLVVFVIYGQLAHAFRAAVIESPKVQEWLRRSFAAAFTGLGLQLAMTER